MSVIRQCWGGLPGYGPLDGQRPIHKTRARIIIVKGGNGSGKSEAVCADLAYQLQEVGRMGFLPVRAWVFRPKFADLKEEDPIYEKLWFGHTDHRGFHSPYIAPAMQDGQLQERGRVMRVRNGSTATMWSYNQSPQAAAGQTPNIIVADEELPHAMFKELNARLIRGSGTYLIMGATLVGGEPYIDELEQRAAAGDPDIAVFKLLTHANSYLDNDQVEFAERMMPEHERIVRIYGGSRGQYARVYHYSQENRRTRPELPDEGTDYVFIDPGISSYTAALWVRAVPNGREAKDGRPECDLWCHREYYKRGMYHLPTLCQEIMETNDTLNPAEWFMDPYYSVKRQHTSRPDMESLTYHQMFNDEMAKWGVKVTLGPRTREMRRGIRAMKTRRWIDIADRGRPNIYVVSDLRYLLTELNGYQVEGFDQSKR